LIDGERRRRRRRRRRKTMVPVPVEWKKATLRFLEIRK
jgi:hypothetical protein